MAVVVVATVVPVPEHRSEVIEALAQTIAAVQAEGEGCELCALHEGNDRLVMIEKWTTEEALSNYRQGPAMQELNRVFAGKLAGEVDVQVLHPHRVGNAEQGAL